MRIGRGCRLDATACYNVEVQVFTGGDGTGTRFEVTLGSFTVFSDDNDPNTGSYLGFSTAPNSINAGGANPTLQVRKSPARPD